MHGHHAHRVARPLLLALHLETAALDPVHEALQARRGELLVVQRLPEQLLDRVGGVGAEPAPEPPAPAPLAEEMGEHVIGAGVVGTRGDLLGTGGGEPLLDEELERGVEQFLGARFLAALAGRGGGFCGHRDTD